METHGALFRSLKIIGQEKWKVQESVLCKMAGAIRQPYVGKLCHDKF